MADSVPRESRRLKSSRAALDNLDYIVQCSLNADPNHRIQLSEWSAIKLVFDGLRYIDGLTVEFAFNESPNVVRSYIHAVRARIQDRIDVLEPDEPAPASISGRTPSAIQALKSEALRLGLNSANLAVKVRRCVHRTDCTRAVDKSTIARVLSGETKNPHPVIQNALLEVLEFSQEKAQEIRRALGWGDHPINPKK